MVAKEGGRKEGRYIYIRKHHMFPLPLFSSYLVIVSDGPALGHTRGGFHNTTNCKRRGVEGGGREMEGYIYIVNSSRGRE